MPGGSRCVRRAWQRVSVTSFRVVTTIFYTRASLATVISDIGTRTSYPHDLLCFVAMHPFRFDERPKFRPPLLSGSTSFAGLLVFFILRKLIHLYSHNAEKHLTHPCYD